MTSHDAESPLLPNVSAANFTCQCEPCVKSRERESGIPPNSCDNCPDNTGGDVRCGALCVDGQCFVKTDEDVIQVEAVPSSPVLGDTVCNNEDECNSTSVRVEATPREEVPCDGAGNS